MWRFVDFFPKDGVLSFHTCTLTVNHGLFQDKKFMEYKPRSANVGKSFLGETCLHVVASDDV